ncbi:hypothetical protein MNEG_7516 [Monoraphidium neglectum]|uniref:CARDB domain-containing protein n=1 Tax=Monoraphidium neglectum TaxID=145388 RepID=A0A0D2JMN4_9CHLO|nr:hypothetical protein MNEG_7516 [Monoraphidium neglectum]KIZ00448.1 hypothetical protein MNEG_7516 [Monoraphidium neglectum]|eukprot:XP_013899467.1 hypothetical protein MNEG_7516 [Monoraphidium neglectum]
MVTAGLMVTPGQLVGRRRLSPHIEIGPTCIVKGFTSNFSLSTADGANAKSAFGFKISKASKSAAANVRLVPNANTAKALGSTIVCINLPAVSSLCSTVDRLCGASACKVNVTTSKFKPAGLVKPKSLPCCLKGAVNILPGLPATLQPTVTVNLTYTVTNNGTAASPAATFAFWLDRPITPACNDVTGATGALRPLAAGESRAKFLVVTLPGAPGQYTLRLLLDSACIVNEISETDHLASLPYLISTTIGPVANLALTSLALSTSPSSGAFTPGQLVNLTVGVLNNGTAASTSSVLSVFTDSPVTPTCRGLGRAVGTSVDVLAAGSSANITVTVPGPLSFGAKTLQVVLDSECTVIETTRADNVAGVSYTVAAPDFVASNLQVIPLGGPVLQVGTIFSVNATITNVGTAAGDPGLFGAFTTVSSPAGCGDARLNSPLGSYPWSAGSIPPGASVTAQFTGFRAEAVPGKYVLWFVVNYLCRPQEPNFVDNQLNFTYTI